MAVDNRPSFNLSKNVYTTQDGPLDKKQWRFDDADRDLLITSQLVKKGHEFYHETDSKWYRLGTYPTPGSLTGVVWVDGRSVAGSTTVVTDNLTSDSATEALSAKQGKVLKTAVDAKVTYPSADSTKVGHITVTQAVNLDTMESGLALAIILKGEWDSTTGSFPSGSVKKGWSYTVSDQVTLSNKAFGEGDRLVALIDNPSTTVYLANWQTLVGDVSAIKADILLKQDILLPLSPALTPIGSPVDSHEINVTLTQLKSTETLFVIDLLPSSTNTTVINFPVVTEFKLVGFYFTTSGAGVTHTIKFGQTTNQEIYNKVSSSIDLVTTGGTLFGASGLLTTREHQVLCDIKLDGVINKVLVKYTSTISRN